MKIISLSLLVFTSYLLAFDFGFNEFKNTKSLEKVKPSLIYPRVLRTPPKTIKIEAVKKDIIKAKKLTEKPFKVNEKYYLEFYDKLRVIRTRVNDVKVHSEQLEIQVADLSTTIYNRLQDDIVTKFGLYTLFISLCLLAIGVALGLMASRK